MTGLEDFEGVEAEAQRVAARRLRNRAVNARADEIIASVDAPSTTPEDGDARRDYRSPGLIDCYLDELADERVDLVYVATPSYLLTQIIQFGADLSRQLVDERDAVRWIGEIRHAVVEHILPIHGPGSPSVGAAGPESPTASDTTVGAVSGVTSFGTPDANPHGGAA